MGKKTFSNSNLLILYNQLWFLLDQNLLLRHINMLRKKVQLLQLVLVVACLLQRPDRIHFDDLEHGSEDPIAGIIVLRPDLQLELPIN